jgi:hypothetical protein
MLRPEQAGLLAVVAAGGVLAGCDSNPIDASADAADVPCPTWYLDSDGDGFGGTSSIASCTQPTGYVQSDDDCDDGSPDRFPGNRETCDELDNDCDATTVERCPDGCAVKLRSGGSRYLFCGPTVATREAWTAAEATCIENLFRLARIDDATENGYLQSQAAIAFPGSPTFYIGGTDAADEGTWRWTDGVDFWMGTAQGGAAVGGLYTNWRSTEPDNAPLGPSGEDCVAVDTGNGSSQGQWSDHECSVPAPYVCERTP